LQPIRTAAEIHAKIIIQPLEQIPLYQKLSQKVKELYLSGMPYRKIAKALNIDKKTAIKACKYKSK
jgi:transposase-like protein